MGSIETPTFTQLNQSLDYDVLIIGAGLSGIYTLHRMRQLGLRCKILEAAPSVGGTWSWNRYPGARFDSESYTYGFSFSQEILDEWDWSEHFAGQPEILRYAEFICEKFNLRGDMQFDTTIVSAHWQEGRRCWMLKDEKGVGYTSRFLITAMGVLNKYTLPNIPGVKDYQGTAYHTARWPHEPVDFTNKRVAVIGTGATGIQAIQEIAKTAGHLTVFQRTPNWSAPLRNDKIDKEEMEDIRKRYPDIFARCKATSSGFLYSADDRKTIDVSPEEREAFWESLYAQRGFAKWIGNFADTSFDREANALYSEFMANKIRQRVHDPVTAEKLIPKCHGFGTKRVPLESGYFEVYNQSNVRLVDAKESPIERITSKGIKTPEEEFEFDMIVYATGFDEITGSFTAVDLQGVSRAKLSDCWSKGAKTFLGMFAHKFPNMMMVLGPHQIFGNVPRSIQYAVEWVAEFVQYCRDNGITYAEATEESVEKWTEHVHNCSKGFLSNEVDSWMTGVNKNLAHKQHRTVARYAGPASGYRKLTQEVADRKYTDLKRE